MAIDRTLFDLWVNDTGDNLTGTLINKARIADDILDPIDDALAAGSVAGSTTQVMFNDAGALAGDAGLVYNKTTDALTVGSLVPTLGQIVFPATANASSNANTLDDYEEGTFTWTDASGATLTFVQNTGRFVKVGKQVLIIGYLQYPTTSDGSNALLGGLPFTAGAGYGGLTVIWGDIDCKLMVDASTTQVQIFTVGTTTRKTNVNMTDKSFRFSGIYESAT